MVPSTSQRRKHRRYWTAFRHGVVATCALPQVPDFPCVHEAVFPPPGLETIVHHPPPGLKNTVGLAQPASHIEINYLDFVLKLTKSDICGGTTTQRCTVGPNGPCAAELNDNASEVVYILGPAVSLRL